MIIPNHATLCATADERLQKAPSIPTITLIYAGLTLGINAVVLIVQYLLDSRIGNLGGLSNMGLRSVLETVAQILSFAQMGIVMCLELGYRGVMLRSARELNVRPATLRCGFERFFPLLRASLLRGLVYAVMTLGSFYAAVLVYSYSPLSRGLNSALEPILDAVSVNPELLLTNPAVLSALRSAVPVILGLGALIFLIFGTPVIYGYRMTDYFILDEPRRGARYAMRMSKRMMRGARRQLLRVDLHFWWYYVLTVLAGIVGYSDVILSRLGVVLPVSTEVMYFLSYGLYVLFQLVIYYFFKARIAQVYALIYDSGLPKQAPTDGVVLGNIFQM